ncbi:hypothetical protein N9N67_01895 [Bacteriovoracaceae bacterium]|nr:hypothetical protein [Bacteriovoracaceae bacterium]
MKNVGIFIDFLLEKNETTFILEQLVALYDEVTIYTLSHQQGKLQAPIELNSIQSTYLSNKIKNNADIKKQFYLIPHARKTLIPKRPHEAIIIFNNGNLSNLVIDQKYYNLRIELNFLNKNIIPGSGWKTRLFKSFYEQSTGQREFLPFSLQMEYKGERAQLQNMSFCADFSQFDLSKNIVKEKIVVSSSISNDQLTNILNKLSEYQVPSDILSQDSSDQEKAEKFSSAYLFIVEGRLDYIDALRAKASGLSVYNCSETDREFYEQINISFLNISNLEDELKEVIVSKHRIDQDKMRREALKYNAQNFKRKFLKSCEKLFLQLAKPSEPARSFHSV